MFHAQDVGLSRRLSTPPRSGYTIGSAIPSAISASRGM